MNNSSIQFGEANNRQPRLFLIPISKISTVVGCKLDAGSPEGLAEAPERNYAINAGEQKLFRVAWG